MNLNILRALRYAIAAGITHYRRVRYLQKRAARITSVF